MRMTSGHLVWLLCVFGATRPRRERYTHCTHECMIRGNISWPRCAYTCTVYSYFFVNISPSPGSSFFLPSFLPPLSLSFLQSTSLRPKEIVTDMISKVWLVLFDSGPVGTWFVFQSRIDYWWKNNLFIMLYIYGKHIMRQLRIITKRKIFVDFKEFGILFTVGLFIRKRNVFGIFGGRVGRFHQKWIDWRKYLLKY